jgi:transcriptional regulator with XRE-family HTH domain
MPYSGTMARQLTKPRPAYGAHLVVLRKAAGLTQAELAELVGETQQNVAFWEQSDKPPRSDVLPKFASALGVDVRVLLNIDSKPHRRGGPTGKVRMVFEEVSHLPRREQKAVVEVVSALVLQYKSRAS